MVKKGKYHLFVFQGGTELQAVAGTLSEQDPNKYGNSAEVELQWAMKAYHHAETYNNLIKSVDSKFLKLTQIDDEIYTEFRKEYPAFNVDILNEDEIKSPSAKEKWRPFCERYKNRVEDYNMGTLVRIKAAEEFSEANSLLVVRVQFLAIEIARNREGFNDKLRQKKS